jgi:lysyl endopeptidase
MKNGEMICSLRTAWVRKNDVLRVLSLVLGLLLVTQTGLAQISNGGTPPSQTYSIKSEVPTVSLPVTNVADLKAEDELESKDIPKRFGAPIEVALNLDNSGVWTDLPDGGRMWRLRIETPGAYSVNLVYDKFYMPKGGQFFLYNDGYRFLIGSFTSFNNAADGQFATQPVPDDAITLEYYEPAAVRGEGTISVMRVVHAYRNMFGYRDSNSLDDYGESGSCNNDVACDAVWNNEEQGVVMLLASDMWRFCTGSLINTVGNPGTPYILTANHCSPASTSIAMFNYESPTCGGADGPTTQTVQGGTQRFNTSSDNSSDCFLWQLTSAVPLSYNPYYNGWNANNVAATQSVGIHHPSGDVKKISWDNDPPVSSTYGSTANTHWNIEGWDDGTTEGGSSGSPLFDQNHRITGQLHGGAANCSYNYDDYYGKLSYSMTAGLRAWLDPSNTGVMTLDGYNPNTATPSIAVTSPNTAVVWYIGDANNITWSSANFTENVDIHINRSYSGGAWEQIVSNTANDGSHSWTVTGVATTAARIRVQGHTTTTVNDVSDVNFTVAQRSITVTSPNTAVTWYAGEANNITWSSVGLTGTVNIDINRAYSGGTWESIVTGTANDGTHSWTVTTPTTSAARIRVTSVTYPTVSDVSDADFTVAERTITVTNPNTAVTWVVGESQTITWTSANITGTVNIHINRSYSGGTWESIVAGTANDGSHAWTVTSPLTSAARIRVTSVTYPTVSDVSDENFTIANRSITVTSPNTAVTWISGESNTITWTSANITGTVNIHINRSYSGGTWEQIVAGTPNDGSHAWTVTSPLTMAARIRVTSVSYPTVSDVSDADFTIAERTITVTSPNTAVTWYTDELNDITWTSANITGTVSIHINRSYSGGTWEQIVAGTINNGTHPWTVTLPATAAARIRVTSDSYPAVSDISDANFTIIEWNDPPIITHKRLDDQNIEPFDVVAYVTDDAGGFVTRFHYRFVGATGYDSLLLAATINPDQYSVAATLPEGEYEYFVRVIDAGGLSASTSVLNFEVGAFCGLEQAYDDGSAEASHWSENVGYKWAVRFDAGVGSYVLSHARIGVSAENPTANYSALQVSLYLADGELGAPGTLLMTKSLGSLGNVVGGVPVDVDNWVDAVFTDEAGDPIVLTGDFYISISNPVENLYDAFLHDEDGTIAGRSFVYDPCEELWIDESDTGYDSARPGNRMIRVFGFSLTPPEIVASVIVGTSDIKLDWDSIGAPYYQVYSSLDSEGPFTELEGTTATNSFVDEDALTDEMKFYIVQTSVQP